MYIVYIGMEGGKPVATAEQSSKLDVARDKADFVAHDMPSIVVVTVRHHRHPDEIYYSVRGEL